MGQTWQREPAGLIEVVEMVAEMVAAVMEILLQVGAVVAS